MTSRFELKGMHLAVRRSSTALALVLCTAGSPAAARADVVLDWNAIAVTVTTSPDPYGQSRALAITQLAVFEAVNAIVRKYDPYLDTIVAPMGASTDAAAIAAAHAVLKNYYPGFGAALDSVRARDLALIPDGPAKSGGIATGEAAAAAMIMLRIFDNSSPPEFHVPPSLDPDEWQVTPSCPPAGGTFLHWPNVTPFGIPNTRRYILQPPPSLRSRKYTRDYIEVKAVGGVGSTERPQDRSVVAQFYAVSSPSNVLNLAARQIAVAQGRTQIHNARTLALLNMAINDSWIASFANKYLYRFVRPETAIRAADMDGNPRTDPDITFMPFIITPCFPSYPSNHAAGINSGAEVLRRIYGGGGHAITISSPFVPNVALQYTRLKQITDDVDDARIFGGIHYRFDQDGGTLLGREVGAYVHRHYLRRERERHHHHHRHDRDCDSEDDDHQ